MKSAQDLYKPPKKECTSHIERDAHDTQTENSRLAANYDYLGRSSTARLPRVGFYKSNTEGKGKYVLPSFTFYVQTYPFHVKLGSTYFEVCPAFRFASFCLNLIDVIYLWRRPRKHVLCAQTCPLKLSYSITFLISYSGWLSHWPCTVLWAVFCRSFCLKTWDM